MRKSFTLWTCALGLLGIFAATSARSETIKIACNA